MKVGVTGHQSLPEQAVRFLRLKLADLEVDATWTVLSSLAAGADQIVADALLQRGATLVAVIPARGYASTFSDAEARSAFVRLRDVASEVIVLDHAAPSEEAFFEAGRFIVDRCDQLLAVWDGQASRGLGGTADVVAYAAKRGVEVHVVWPEGVSR